jgi:hypothetical protein
MVTYFCANCNKEMIIVSSRKRNRKHRYCSKECETLHRRASKCRQYKIVSYCEWCGKETKKVKSVMTKIKHNFCSISCASKHRIRIQNIRTPFFKDGRTPLRSLIKSTSEYKKWVFDVLSRDKFMCVICGCGKNLHVHHKTPFSNLLEKFLSEFSQFSPLEDKETLLRLIYSRKEFWDLTNGITLCCDCHQVYHPDLNLNLERGQQRCLITS